MLAIVWLLAWAEAGAWNPHGRAGVSAANGASEQRLWRLPNARHSGPRPAEALLRRDAASALEGAVVLDASATARITLNVQNKLNYVRSELLPSIGDPSEARCVRLEQGLDALRQASGVRSPKLLETVLRAIGLQGDGGLDPNVEYEMEDANNILEMIPSMEPSVHSGLGSVPAELSCLLRKAASWNVSSVLELGAGSGFSAAVLATYLRWHTGGHRPVDVHTVDVIDRRLDCVRRLHASLGIKFHEVEAELVANRDDMPQHYDVCLLDHEETEAASKAALTDFRGRCGRFVAQRITSGGKRDGGYAAFWRSLKASLPNAVDYECAVRPGGIGFVVYKP
eukprot:TRINITY_DN50089_c0_g1_i1.p1 TRINITY_DN50089_c0_g1~~TRINITY_DN50089_c0_g1_i1.p1  ORF type:complete len:339 (+),score=75.70 TRINITY_DN50089_c0_g1_i1:112-1128(+)